MKININFPVTGNALSDALSVNLSLGSRIRSVISFGVGGNSSPHVTLIMGDVRDENISKVTRVTRTMVEEITHPIPVQFGPPYRETVTGRYIFSDASVPDSFTAWRSRLRSAASIYFMNSARMTEDEFHLTLGVLEAPSDEIDGYLASLPALSASTFSCVDISLAGAKGAKLDLLSELAIQND